MAKKDQEPKKFVLDHASGRLISAGPEEIDATQPLLELLIDVAGWQRGQIISRPKQWRVKTAPSDQRKWPVDVAIFDDPANCRDPEHVTIFCECKRPDESSGVEQLKIYMDREPHVRVGVWYNGIDHRIVYKTVTGYVLAPPGTPIPSPKDPLVPTGSKVLTYNDLRNAPSLVPIFRQIRDRLATMDRNVNRDEEILPDISLLLLLKVLDEQTHKVQPHKPLSFQIDVSPQRTAQRIKEHLAVEARRNSQLFGGKDVHFQVDDDSISYVLQTLQNYRVLTNDRDAISDAFQVIRGKAYKGEEGQYFTPQSVVQVAVAAADPEPQHMVIDPACGSGSFLAAALANVVEHLHRLNKGDESAVIVGRREWSSHKLFGIDKDSVSVRLSKAYLSMLGDGSAHVFKADSVRRAIWDAALASTVMDGSFDVVVTNPPFGTQLKVSVEVGREENYELSRRWKYVGDKWEPTDEFEERDLGLIFLERCIRLLADGGKLAIVLPDTYLFSDSYGWLVQWLSQWTITHSINVPIEAFEPHCRAKTSVLVLKKSPPAKNHQIVGSYCETYGEDKHGRTRFKFVDMAQTDERDDEMSEAAVLIRSKPKETSKLHFKFSQAEAVEKGVLVASFWWRKPYIEALEAFAAANGCELVSVGQLIDDGELTVGDGHGSPHKHLHGRGTIPYVKVVDLKNWRVIENPKYAIPAADAIKFRRDKALKPYDLLTPTRCTRNIGLFSVVMPWQTQVILTREIGVWRVTAEAKRIDPWLLLALASLRVVHEQFRFLVLMQMNREHLGSNYRELLLPIPKKPAQREQWSKPIRAYFEATAKARESYEALGEFLKPELFADRP